MQQFEKLTAVRNRLVLLFFCVVTPTTLADEQSDASLAEMHALALATKISIEAEPGQPPKLLSHPVFRYSDAPRRISDAALWAWTVDGRPVAVQKVESGFYRGTDKPRWTYCLTSLSEHNIRADWSQGQSFSSSGSGISYQPIPGATSVASTSVARRLQMKQLASQFSATTTTNPDGTAVQQMRLLPRPILEYSSTENDLPTGAVFGLTANGTNPDAFIIIDLHTSESKDTEWRYGVARMTTSGLEVRLQNRVVWTERWVRPVPTSFPTWTFFFTDK